MFNVSKLQNDTGKQKQKLGQKFKIIKCILLVLFLQTQCIQFNSTQIS